MPTYEYKCKKCNHEFEAVQRITEDPLKDCVVEGCDGEVYRKISKNIGLVFNGSGFYLTDYAKKSSSASSSTNGSSEKSNGSAESTANSNDSTDSKNGSAESSQKSNGTSENKASSSEKPKAKSAETAKV
jgi:putative FmdB family regulatory protein